MNEYILINFNHWVDLTRIIPLSTIREVRKHKNKTENTFPGPNREKTASQNCIFTGTILLAEINNNKNNSSKVTLRTAFLS